MVTGAADTDVVWLASFQNSLGAVRFDADEATVTGTIETTHAGSMTYLYVGSFDEVEAAQYSWGVMESGTSVPWCIQVQNEALDITTPPTVNNEVEHVIAAGEVFAMCATVDEESGEMVVRSTHGSRTVVDYSSGIANLNLDDAEAMKAPQEVGTESHVGNMGEAILWDGLQDLDQIATYVSNKWNLTIS
jgi:hypothetical protein